MRMMVITVGSMDGDEQLDGAATLITGASSGVGAATADAFARDGTNVAL